MPYYILMDQLHWSTQELDYKLPMYFIVLKDKDVIKKLIAIVRFATHSLSCPSILNLVFVVDLDHILTETFAFL